MKYPFKHKISTHIKKIPMLPYFHCIYNKHFLSRPLDRHFFWQKFWLNWFNGHVTWKLKSCKLKPSYLWYFYPQALVRYFLDIPAKRKYVQPRCPGSTEFFLILTLRDFWVVCRHISTIFPLFLWPTKKDTIIITKIPSKNSEYC